MVVLLTLRESGDHFDIRGHRGTSEAVTLRTRFPEHQQALGRVEDLLLVRAAEKITGTDLSPAKDQETLCDVTGSVSSCNLC